MNQAELETILQQHALWLVDHRSGKKAADLSGADMYEFSKP